MLFLICEESNSRVERQQHRPVSKFEQTRKQIFEDKFRTWLEQMAGQGSITVEEGLEIVLHWKDLRAEATH